MGNSLNRLLLDNPPLYIPIIGCGARLWKLSNSRLLTFARPKLVWRRKKTLAETSADDRPDLIRLRFKLVFSFVGQPHLQPNLIGGQLFWWLRDPN